MAWWRKNWRWLLAVIVAVLGLVVVAVLYVVSKRREAENLLAQLALMKAGAKVGGLLAEKRVTAHKLSVNDEATKKLDKQIADAKRRAVATVKAVEGMSDDDIADEFRNMGY